MLQNIVILFENEKNTQLEAKTHVQFPFSLILESSFIVDLAASTFIF